MIQRVQFHVLTVLNQDKEQSMNSRVSRRLIRSHTITARRSIQDRIVVEQIAKMPGNNTHQLVVAVLLSLSFCWCDAFLPMQQPLSAVSPLRAPTPLPPPATSLQALPPAVASFTESLFAYSGNVPVWQAASLNALLFGLLSKKLLKSLTPEGMAHSFALAVMLWTTLGWRGWTYCVLYLVCGNIVTKVRFKEKEAKGLAEGRGGRRGPENVWGSALTGLVCAACSVQGASFLGISSELYLLGYVASLATKLADTFASEIGKAYGKTTFLITTLQPAEPGTEGAVSLEGTLAAVGGGLILSLYGWAVGLITTPAAVGVSTLAAFLATNAESVLGATIQGKKGLEWVTNEVVNGINTAIGAALAIGGGIIFLGM